MAELSEEFKFCLHFLLEMAETGFMGTPNSENIYNTSLLTDSYAFLKSMNN
jgi:hypothetical protein